MVRNPFGITEKEAEVLRLIDKTRTSGEIATLVGRSTHTVDAQIKSARRRLGNVDRYRAADLLRRWEADNPTGVNPPLGIELAAETGATAAASHGSAMTDTDVTPLQRMPEITEANGAGQPSKTRRGTADETTTLKIVALIVGIAAAATVLVLAAPELAIGAQKIACRILPSFKPRPDAARRTTDAETTPRSGPVRRSSVPPC